MTEPQDPRDQSPPPPRERPSALLATLRVPLLALWTLLCGATAGTGLLVRPLWPRSSRTIRTVALRLWGKGFLLLLGIRVEVRGEAPHPPFLLVSNHLSYVDIPLLASLLRCVFVSKAEVRDWPGFGLAARAADTIFIDRARARDTVRVLEQMEQARKFGDGIVFFPEGTSGKGDRIAPLKPALLDGAVRSGQPVHFAVISYRTQPAMPPAHEVVCWWGDNTFFPHLWRMMGYPGFTAYVTFGSETLTAEDRKALAARLQDALEGEFSPVTG